MSTLFTSMKMDGVTAVIRKINVDGIMVYEKAVTTEEKAIEEYRAWLKEKDK